MHDRDKMQVWELDFQTIFYYDFGWWIISIVFEVKMGNEIGILYFKPVLESLVNFLLITQTIDLTIMYYIIVYYC